MHGVLRRYAFAQLGNAVFAGFNAIVTFWALTAYIGIWHSVQDMVVGLVRWFFVPIKDSAGGGPQEGLLA